MDIIEVRENLGSVIDKHARLNIYNLHYGHLLPKDEKDRSILSPAVIARVAGMGEEKIREAIERQKDGLKSEGLLLEMPEVGSDF